MADDVRPAGDAPVVEPEDSLLERPAAVLKNRTAYVNLRRNGLAGKQQTEILSALTTENNKDILPEFGYTTATFLKLVFYCEEQRDRAVEKKLSIFSTRVELEKPVIRVQTKRRVLHLNEIPLSIPDEEVANWLKKFVTGLEIISNFRWITSPNSPIKTGERTVIVQTPITYNFPGFAWFKTDDMRNSVKIRIWYYGMPVHCSKCLQLGHMRKECPSEAALPPRSNDHSYAAIAARRPSTTLDIQDQEKSIEDTVDKPHDENLIIMPEITIENDQPKNKSQSNIFPFYTYKNTFSNHFPTKFSHKGIEYNSTEHFLFYRRAEEMGQNSMADEILRSKKAATAKKIGENVYWDNKKFGPWEKFASDILRQANELKYQQNDDLRAKLFETAPKRLVEASPYDLTWGAGMSESNLLIHNPATWKGRNLFGDLLTKLRDEMMARETPVEKVQEIDEESKIDNGKGKKRQCSLSPPGVENKSLKNN